MSTENSSTYRSAWDFWTWFILLLIAACAVAPILLDSDDGLLPSIIAGTVLILTIIIFLSIRYRIDPDNLTVYQNFRAKTYPIAKIKEIKPTTLNLAAPATSLTHRLAITFTDPALPQRSAPLIISPVRQAHFIAHLRQLNPQITTTPTTL